MSIPRGAEACAILRKPGVAALRFAVLSGVLTAVLLSHSWTIASPTTRTVRIVDAPLDRDGIARQAAALATDDGEYWRIAQLGHGETIGTLLRRLKLNDGALRAAITGDRKARPLGTLRPGDEVYLAFDRHGTLMRLMASLGDGAQTTRRVVVERATAKRFIVSEEFRRHDVFWRYRAGIIDGGFFSSMARAEVPGQVTAALMRLFSDRIDFRNGFREGDRFRIIYKSVLNDAGATAVGQVLAVELQAKGQWHQALWHRPPPGAGAGAAVAAGAGMGRIDAAGAGVGGIAGAVAGDRRFADANGAYYRFDGTPLAQSPWRFPVAGHTRLSSGFGYRIHPLSGHRRHHTGIDLAAKEGTGVQAAAAGTVTFVGWQGGYGKLVIVQHDARYSTYYAHLRGFAPSIRPGRRVAQGQMLGAVGQTGDVTGAHLHFEVRDHGRPVDPAFALRATTRRLNRHALTVFRQSTAPLLAQMTRMRQADAQTRAGRDIATS